MNAHPIDPHTAESLLAFWADAGVEDCYDDAPVDRTVFLKPTPAAQVVARAVESVAPVANIADALSEARRLAAGADTLEALQLAITEFHGCPLRTMGATQAVYARGSPQAPVLIIGEGPGADEDRAGQPFVGRAGKLLDRMLDAAGLQDQVFITNTVFWRPPGNRTPTPQEQAVCAPFVERTFELLKPRAVLLLGAAAAKSVLRADEGILKLRGQWREWRLPEGDVSAPVMPTLHPAFLLRQPLAKRQAWADVLSLAARIAVTI